MAAAKTGVIKLSILITKNKEILIKDRMDFLFFKPGIASVRLVINKLVKPIVVLTPAKITLTTAIS